MFQNERLQRQLNPQRHIAPLIGGAIISGIGSLLGAGISYAGQNETNSNNLAIAQANNAFNASEANKNRDYQTLMSNTAHQREVADLRSAGLNPLLSANTGASSPGGATASSSGNPTMQNPFSGIDIGGTLRDMMQLSLQSQQVQADTRVKDAQAAATISNTNLDPSRKALMLQQIEESKYRSHPNSMDQLVTRYIDRFARSLENNAREGNNRIRESTKNFLKQMKPEDWSKIQNALESRMKGNR